jgi:sigma-B regulation protein RsbU (phosphoserine phosphatase)
MSQKAQLEISKKELEKDLEVSGMVQNLIIPEARSVRSDFYEYSFHFEPATKAGGDWVWNEMVENGNLYFILGDVTGHGVGSAMIAALIAGVLNSDWKKSKSLLNAFRSMDDILKTTCQSKYGMSVTGIHLDVKNCKIDLINMGSPPLFLLRDTECNYYGEAGSILGSGEFVAGVNTIDIIRGDKIIIFSDGLYEAQDKDNREFGMNRLRRFLTKQPIDISSELMKENILKEFRSWIGDRPLNDDLSFVVIKVY